MRGVTTLGKLELKSVWTSRPAAVALVLYLVAGVAALMLGRAAVKEQHRVLKASAAIDAEEDQQSWLQHPQDEAGLIAYSLFRSTKDEPSSWAAVALGQRDINAYALRIRALGIESQLYDAELGNPLLRLGGAFDLAFVWSVLGPLLLIALAYGSLSDDKERGSLRLLLSLGVDIPRLIAFRVGLRALLVLVAQLLLLIAAAMWVPLPFDGRLLHAVLVLAAYSILWWAIVTVVVLTARTGVRTAIILVSVWLCTGTAVPALVNVCVETFYPVPEGLELTLRQRMTVHDGWDRPRAEVLNAFALNHPQWKSFAAAAPKERFSWIWYYANWEEGDRAVAEMAKAYRTNLLSRHAVSVWISSVLPPVQSGLLLTQLAKTDMPARISYLDSVRDYHQQMKQFLYTRAFAGEPLSKTDYQSIPEHKHTSKQVNFDLSDYLPLAFSTGVMLLTALIFLRRRSSLPASW